MHIFFAEQIPVVFAFKPTRILPILYATDKNSKLSARQTSFFVTLHFSTTGLLAKKYFANLNVIFPMNEECREKFERIVHRSGILGRKVYMNYKTTFHMNSKKSICTYNV